MVLKLHPNAFHHGSLAAVRSLGRLGVPVIGVHEDRWAPAAWSRYAVAKVVWRPPSDPDAIVAGLLQLGRQVGRPALLLTTDDAGALLVAERASSLREHFLLPQVDPALPRRLADKGLLHETCVAAGVPTAQGRVVTSRVELLAAALADRPAVLKVAEPWLLPKRAGLSGTAVVRSVPEAVAHYDRLAAAGVSRVVYQEYLDPRSSQDWYVSAYCRAGGEPLACFTARKLRSWPPKAGFTTLGVVRENPELVAVISGLTTSVGYAGILDADVRFDERDGRYKLLDFNPRVGANFRTFEDCEGTDVVRACYRDLACRPAGGPPVPLDTSPPVGQARQRIFMVEAHDLASSIAGVRAGTLTTGEWLRSVRGPREVAWWAGDDPLPLAAMLVGLVGRALLRRRERARARRPVATTPGSPSPARNAGPGGDSIRVRWSRARGTRRPSGTRCVESRNTVDSR